MKTTTLLLLVKEDAILLAMKKRGFGQGKWNGVGGKVEPGETIEEAVIRECQEEIEVNPKTFEKMAVIDFTFTDDTLDMQTHVYVATDWEGTPKETEEMAPKWYKISDIPFDEMWQDDIIWMPLVLQGRKLACRFTFTDDTMLSGTFDIVPTL